MDNYVENKKLTLDGAIENEHMLAETFKEGADIYYKEYDGNKKQECLTKGNNSLLEARYHKQLEIFLMELKIERLRQE